MTEGNEVDSGGAAIAQSTEVSSAGPSDTNVSFLDQALWRQLEQETDANGFFAAWLALQCRRANRLEGGVLYLAGSADEMTPIAVWPRAVARTTRLDAAAQLARNEGRAVLKAAPGTSAESAGTASLAVPILEGDTVLGVIAATQSAGADSKENIRSLQWGNAWIRHRLVSQKGADNAAERERSAKALSLVAALMSEDDFLGTVTVLVTELARRLDCDRVSIGIRKDKRSVLKAISNNAQFAEKMDLVRALEAAMDEAIDQDTAILLPDEDGDVLVIRGAHDQLMRTGRAAYLMTVPLLEGDRVLGALTFERPAGRPFTEGDLRFIDAVGSIAAPIVGTRYRDQQWIGAKLTRTFTEQTKDLLGPRHYGKKLALASVLGLGLFAAVATGEHVVAADAALEGRVKRIVAAPVDGYVAASFFRAGDDVLEGDVLATLDDRDLTLELQNWETVRRQRQRESDRAMAERDPVELRIIEAQLEQAAAQVALLEARLARTVLEAPFDGLIVSGDLTQSIGAAVARGDVLFELAPAGGYRVLLSIPETDLDHVVPQQKGRVVLAAFPGRPIPFEIERVTPVAQVSDGANVFLAEAVLGPTDLPLRPGMEGIGKIEIDRRRLLWIWTHDMGEFLRLHLWRLWG